MTEVSVIFQNLVNGSRVVPRTATAVAAFYLHAVDQHNNAIGCTCFYLEAVCIAGLYCLGRTRFPRLWICRIPRLFVDCSKFTLFAAYEYRRRLAIEAAVT